MSKKTRKVYCNFCKAKGKSFKQMMRKNQSKQATLSSIRKYWNHYLLCDKCKRPIKKKKRTFTKKKRGRKGT